MILLYSPRVHSNRITSTKSTGQHIYVTGNNSQFQNSLSKMQMLSLGKPNINARAITADALIVVDIFVSHK